MPSRRTFIIRLAGSAATATVLGCSHLPVDARRTRPFVYASEGNVLAWYALDVDTADLKKMGSVKLAETVQFAAMHPARRFLYAAVSNGGPGATGDNIHYISTLMVDRDNGSLQLHGELVPLPSRPIHIAVDPAGQYLLVTFSKPAAVRVYHIDARGRAAQEIPQAGNLDVGIFPHQLSLASTGDMVYVCGRGNDALPGKPADIGTLTSFHFRDGQLRPLAHFRFGEGLGPRDMEIHPSKPWAFIALERGNKLAVHGFDGATLIDRPLFVRDTPASADRRPRQRTGVVHIHPNGKFVYIVNRADKTQPQNGKAVFAGGENNIAVFSIDQLSGEPTLVQHVDTHGIEARSFAIDPSGRLLVVGNQTAMHVATERGLSVTPAGLAIFRIGVDGKLDYVRSRNADTSGDLIWTYIVHLD